jgi:alcohol dehydrogenase class IV
LVETGLIQPLLGSLRDSRVDVQIFSDVVPNPRVSTVEAVRDAILDWEADHVVAVGGGSVMDAAKAGSLLSTCGGSLLDYEGENHIAESLRGIVALPTTAGTGSEVTCWAVVTDEDRGLKMAIGAPEIAPRYALIDPALSSTAPPSLTAGSGADALSHAIEAYTAKCCNVMSDALAIRAMEIIGAALPAAVRDGSDMDARGGMAIGSLLAGMALSCSDTCAGHALAEAIGALADAPHGLACAICTPVALEFNAAAVPERVARIGEALGFTVDDLPTAEAVQASLAGLRTFLSGVGTPPAASLGLTTADIPKLVEHALTNLGNPDNPVPLDADAFTRLFATVIEQ